jgi:hypothetical protein
VAATSLPARLHTLWGRVFFALGGIAHTAMSLGAIPLSLLLADVWSSRPGESPYMLIVAIAQAYLWMSLGLMLVPIAAWLTGRRSSVLALSIVAFLLTTLAVLTAVAGVSLALVCVQGAAFAISIVIWVRLRGWSSGLLWAIFGGLPVLPVVMMWRIDR